MLCEIGPVLPVHNTEKLLQTYQWLVGGPAETREKGQNLDHRAIRKGIPSLHTHTYTPSVNTVRSDYCYAQLSVQETTASLQLRQATEALGHLKYHRG